MANSLASGGLCGPTEIGVGPIVIGVGNIRVCIASIFGKCIVITNKTHSHTGRYTGSSTDNAHKRFFIMNYLECAQRLPNTRFKLQSHTEITIRKTANTHSRALSHTYTHTRRRYTRYEFSVRCCRTHRLGAKKRLTHGTTVALAKPDSCDAVGTRGMSGGRAKGC